MRKAVLAAAGILVCALVARAAELPFGVTIGGHAAKDEGRADSAAIVKEAVDAKAEIVIDAKADMIILNIFPANEDGSPKEGAQAAIIIMQGTNKAGLDQTMDKKPLAEGLYRMNAVAGGNTAIVIFRIGQGDVAAGGKKTADIEREANQKAAEASQKAEAENKKAKEEAAAPAKAAAPAAAPAISDDEASTQLVYAIQNGDVDRVKALIASNPKIVTMQDNQPLQSALSLAKAPELVKVLLDAGADVNAKHKESGCGMVALAIDSGKKGPELVAVVKMLVEKGADVNCARPSDGFNALHLAARKGMADVMAVLLTAKGVDVNQRSKDLDSADLDNAWPPLFFAVSRGSEGDPDDLKVAEMLLAKGADVKAATKENYTALYLVANSPADHKDIAELLLAKGAEIDTQIKPQLMTPLHTAMEKDNVEIVKFLLDKGADLNIPNDDGVTIIAHARAAYLKRPGGIAVQEWAEKHPDAVKSSPAGAKTEGAPAKEEAPKKDDTNKKVEEGVKDKLKGLFGR